MMDMPALPPVQSQEVCIAQAVSQYGAHPDLIKAVLLTENTKPGQRLVNKNGSVDMGPMGINSVHLAELARFGITEGMLVYNECLNIVIGTYLLQKAILLAPNYWQGVGNYHSKTPAYNVRYQQRVWDNLQRVQRQRGAQQ